MAYEKADFYASYGFYAVDPDTGIRYANARIPEFPGETITLRLHYHPLVYRREAARKAQQLLDAGLVSASDSLVIVGGAFGWLGEALELLLPGLETATIELSQYVQDAKDLSPDDELIESIQASGFNETTGVGLHLFNTFTDPVARSTTVVIQEDMISNKSRNAVKSALSRIPTRIITEEVWQILTQAEKDQYTAAAADFGVPMTHFIDGVII
jgi:hypothetical protein